MNRMNPALENRATKIGSELANLGREHGEEMLWVIEEAMYDNLQPELNQMRLLMVGKYDGILRPMEYVKRG